MTNQDQGGLITSISEMPARQIILRALEFDLELKALDLRQPGSDVAQLIGRKASNCDSRVEILCRPREFVQFSPDKPALRI